jgi:hypothetical protein
VFQLIVAWFAEPGVYSNEISVIAHVFFRTVVNDHNTIKFIPVATKLLQLLERYRPVVLEECLVQIKNDEKPFHRTIVTDLDLRLTPILGASGFGAHRTG